MLFNYLRHKLLYFLLLIFLLSSGAAFASWNYYRPEGNRPLSFSAIGEMAEEIYSDPTKDSAPDDATLSTNTNNLVKTNGNSNSRRSSGSSGASTPEGNGSSASSTDSAPTSNTNSSSEVPESLSATVAFYADSQTDENLAGENANHQRVVDYIMATNANTVFHAGDLLEDGTLASWNYFNGVTTNLRATKSFYAAQGNNERNSVDYYFNKFEFPGNERWYSVNVGNLHMVILDSAYSSGSAEQLSWLQSDLQSAASQSRITGVMFHHPIHPNDAAVPAMRASYAPVFRDNNVDFVVSGHNHSYYHNTVDGIHYFVTTGQQSIGYFLTKVYSSYATLYAYNSNNDLAETINISNR